MLLVTSVWLESSMKAYAHPLINSCSCLPYSPYWLSIPYDFYWLESLLASLRQFTSCTEP